MATHMPLIDRAAITSEFAELLRCRTGLSPARNDREKCERRWNRQLCQLAGTWNPKMSASDVHVALDRANRIFGCILAADRIDSRGSRT
jgi:hypothetical protein